MTAARKTATKKLKATKGKTAGPKAGENKTKPTRASVESFINSVDNETRRLDAISLLNLMKRITGEPPKMWGPSIIGFGEYHYKYDSGREGDFLIVGFSPRKANLAIYVLGSLGPDEPLLKKLGKHKTGAGCLYVNKLADIDLKVLEQLIAKSYKATKKKWGA